LGNLGFAYTYKLMPTWDAKQYLQFAEYRTRPCRELVERVEVAAPTRVIDLGCGPGNSTAVAAARWAGAEIVGLDSSAQMIEAAKKETRGGKWVVGDIARWAKDNDKPFDVILSNAAMQWVDDHGEAYPRLMKKVAPGGALATQVPGNFDGPAHRAARELAASEAWRAKFASGSVREWHVHELSFYYDILSPVAKRVDAWETEYLHVMPSAEAIVEWYKGTGLRPFLELLGSEEERKRFEADYLEEIQRAYPVHADGRVLFPFRRLFLVAYR
jgi:trans-aconitate 2-methyltransferase